MVPHTVGMVVDAVDEVLRISEDKIEPPSPLVASIHEEYIQGVGKLEDRLVIILDLQKVLSKEEKAKLEEIEETKE